MNRALNSRSSVPARFRPSRSHVVRCDAQQHDGQIAMTRRDALLSVAASLALSGTVALPANAVQGLTAGRIPGKLGQALVGCNMRASRASERPALGANAIGALGVRCIRLTCMHGHESEAHILESRASGVQWPSGGWGRRSPECAGRPPLGPGSNWPRRPRGPSRSTQQALHRAAYAHQPSTAYAANPPLRLKLIIISRTGRTKEPDAEGFYTYTRPEGKSGGHGVGWSEIPQYSFKVRQEPRGSKRFGEGRKTGRCA